LPVNPLKVRRIGQACALTPRQRSDSQPFPPTPAPGGDDPAPTDRAHALAKTVRFGPFSAIRLVSALHRTPLTGAVNFANNPQSISEATVAIQHPETRNKEPTNHRRTALRRRSSGGKCCKPGANSNRSMTNSRSRARVFGVCGLCECPGRRPFQPVIHDLWINLWINTLMSCKSKIYRQTL
jgi:hypothetical protein